MATNVYEQLIVSGIQGLPPDVLAEIADFVYFLRKRATQPDLFEEERYIALLNREGVLFEPDSAFQTMLASEAVLKRDWELPEEDEAWASL